jgi:hypothetical protein
MLKGPFERLCNLFWNTYLEKNGDEEMLTVIQPFYAWRDLVVASPIWYPNLALSGRKKLFGFIRNTLDSERFDFKKRELLHQRLKFDFLKSFSLFAFLLGDFLLCVNRFTPQVL